MNCVNNFNILIVRHMTEVHVKRLVVFYYIIICDIFFPIQMEW